MIVEVHVKPGSKSNSIQKLREPNVFALQVTATAVDGKANAAAIELVADYFNAPKTTIRIKSGHKSKIKLLEFVE